MAEAKFLACGSKKSSQFSGKGVFQDLGISGVPINDRGKGAVNQSGSVPISICSELGRKCRHILSSNLYRKRQWGEDIGAAQVFNCEMCGITSPFCYFL